ncbi:unnamed protein product, partial [Amoebophrya sp. A25]|eukprot:GSA25T00019093001.1
MMEGIPSEDFSEVGGLPPPPGLDIDSLEIKRRSPTSPAKQIVASGAPTPSSTATTTVPSSSNKISNSSWNQGSSTAENSGLARVEEEVDSSSSDDGLESLLNRRLEQSTRARLGRHELASATTVEKQSLADRSTTRRRSFVAEKKSSKTRVNEEDESSEAVKIAAKSGSDLSEILKRVLAHRGDGGEASSLHAYKPPGTNYKQGSSSTLNINDLIGSSDPSARDFISSGSTRIGFSGSSSSCSSSAAGDGRGSSREVEPSLAFRKNGTSNYTLDHHFAEDRMLQTIMSSRSGDSSGTPAEGYTSSSGGVQEQDHENHANDDLLMMTSNKINQSHASAEASSSSSTMFARPRDPDRKFRRPMTPPGVQEQATTENAPISASPASGVPRLTLRLVDKMRAHDKAASSSSPGITAAIAEKPFPDQLRSGTTSDPLLTSCTTSSSLSLSASTKKKFNDKSCSSTSRRPVFFIRGGGREGLRSTSIPKATASRVGGEVTSIPIPEEDIPNFGEAGPQHRPHRKARAMLAASVGVPSAKKFKNGPVKNKDQGNKTTSSTSKGKQSSQPYTTTKQINKKEEQEVNYNPPPRIHQQASSKESSSSSVSEGGLAFKPRPSSGSSTRRSSDLLSSGRRTSDVKISSADRCSPFLSSSASRPSASSKDTKTQPLKKNSYLSADKNKSSIDHTSVMRRHLTTSCTSTIIKPVEVLVQDASSGFLGRGRVFAQVVVAPKEDTVEEAKKFQFGDLGPLTASLSRSKETIDQTQHQVNGRASTTTTSSS